MREIKFRAWHSKQNEMYSAEQMAKDQLTLLPTGRFINVSGARQSLSTILDSMIPLQYTGLKDKNGKEIYEGDILEAPSENNFEVFWSENTTGYLIRDSANTFYINSGLYEIVGNIYQNPELLK